MRKIAFLTSLLLMANMAVMAADTSAIKIEHPWARETPPTVTNGAAYMTLINQGPQPDHLLSVSGDVAARFELHVHSHEGGVMKMRPVDTIKISPGEPTVFQPGGLHIMLIGLKKPLVEGQKFTLLLNFEKAGGIPTEVSVSKTAPEYQH